MASPDGDDLAAELERLQQRVQEIIRLLEQSSPPPSKPTAAERAAKRWGLSALIPAIGAAVWAVTRPRSHYVALLGATTAATGTTAAVLLLPDADPLSQGQPPTTQVTSYMPPTYSPGPMTTTRATATPAPTTSTATTEPTATTSEPAPATTVPSVEAGPTTRVAVPPSTTRATPGRPGTPPDNAPPRSRADPSPGTEEPAPGKSPDEKPDREPPGNAPPKAPPGRPDCEGVHVDASPVAEVCLLG